MVITVKATLLLLLLAPATVAVAENSTPIPNQVAVETPAPAAAVVPEKDPLSANNKSLYRGIKGILLRSAEKMEEENYNFKPVETVRSYGQILGHVADTQYAFCSIVLGEKNPSPNIEKTRTSKAELIAALTDAFAYCDTAYNKMTDTSGTETVKFMGGPKPKFSVLTTNNVHIIEHYGNLIVYMRMKNIIPPTSEPGLIERMDKR